MRSQPSHERIAVENGLAFVHQRPLAEFVEHKGEQRGPLGVAKDRTSGRIEAPSRSVIRAARNNRSPSATSVGSQSVKRSKAALCTRSDVTLARASTSSSR